MKPEGIVTYIRPEDSENEEGFRHHRFEIKQGDKVIAAAEVMYRSKPLPIYQVNELYTESDHQGQGYASAILDQIEAFLLDRKKPGILVDAIHSDKPGVQSMYERRGWKAIDDLGRRAFNWPQDIDTKIMQGSEMRGVDLS
jgi:predicted GNAT family acetyltransferase